MSGKYILGQLEKAQEWMRKPDQADRFSIADLVQWINDRPLLVLIVAQTRIIADAEKIRDLETSLRAFGASGVRDRVAARVGCNADVLQDALQDEVIAAFTPTQETTR